jgi:hypothetical protein
LDEGFDSFIDKPFHIERIYSCLNELLGVEFEFREAPASDTEKVYDPSLVPNLDGLILPQEIHAGLVYAAHMHSVTQLQKHLDELEVLGDMERRLAAHLQHLGCEYNMQAIGELVEAMPVE